MTDSLKDLKKEIAHQEALLVATVRQIQGPRNMLTEIFEQQAERIQKVLSALISKLPKPSEGKKKNEKIRKKANKRR